MFNKELECLACGFSGRAPRESDLCPHCWSDNVLTMTNRQKRIARQRKLREREIEEVVADLQPRAVH